MDPLACGYIDHQRKCKNKYDSQQIQKKFKNRHQWRYNDIDKKYCAKVNRIKSQKSSKIIDFNFKRKERKKQQVSAQNYYTISVHISLKRDTNESNVIRLNHSQYKIIPSQLQNAVIRIYDKSKKLFYLTYCFIPCREFYTEACKDAIYQTRRDCYLPLIFDEYNHLKYNILDLFDDNKLININKPLIDLAQRCVNVRNKTDSSHYSMPYKWKVSDVEYLEQSISVTLTTTIFIADEINSSKFIKSRPFSKKEMSTFDIFDSEKRKTLNCELVTKHGHNTYINVPLLINKDMFCIKNTFKDVKNIILPKDDAPKKARNTKYWFCTTCFMMNMVIITAKEENNLKCIQCKNQSSTNDATFYYDAYVPSKTKSIQHNIKLSHSETKAVSYINNYAQKASHKAKTPLIQRVTAKKCDKLMHFMAEEVPLIIHLHAADVIPKLLRDTHYRNLHEIGTGCGCTNKATRSSHENTMFPNIYSKSKALEKPKYGCLNVGLQPNGCTKARGYGTAFFTLRNETVRWRVSFTNQDSFCANGRLATLRNCDHLLSELSKQELDELCKTAVEGTRGGYKQEHYREIQVHGPLLLSRDIEALHVPNVEKSNAKMYQTFTLQNSCKLIWF